MSIVTWERLKCTECPSETFLPMVYLEWKDGAGTSQKPAGLMCAQCHAQVDSGQMIQRKQVERKREELKALQDELSASNGNGTPPTEKKDEKKDEKKEPATVGK